MSRRPTAVLGAALAALLVPAALLLGGCGGSQGEGADGAGAEAGAEAVSAAQISATPAATPQRTVLEWWHDVQLNDPEGARGLYVRPPSLPNLAGQFNLVAGPLAGAVTVASVRRRGDLATARVNWKPESGEPQRVTLRLERAGATWKLLDARFLDEMVASMQRAEAG